MKRSRGILNDRRGAGALEFALLAPVVLFFLIGMAQLGILFFANAGLHNALAAGARSATLFPRPTELEVKEKIDAERFGLDPANLTIAAFEYGTANSSPYADISLSYRLQLNFVFIETEPITLEQSRRVYLQPTAG